MAITQRVTLYQQKYGSAPTVHAVEGDDGRVLLMVLGDADSVTGATARLAFKRSDDTYYAVNCTTDTTNNGFTANIEQALTQPGTTIAQLKVTASSAVVSTYTFFIEVQKDVGGIATEQEVISVEAAVRAANDAVDAANAAIDNVEEALTHLPEIDYDDLLGVIKITDPTTTMGDVQTMLNAVNTAGDHVVFDLSAISTGMYLATISIGTGYFRIFDLVTGYIAKGSWESTDLLKDKIESGASQGKHYTVQWDKTNSQMTRLNDAASFSTTVTNWKHNGTVNPNYSNPFDNIMPWSGRKLCNIDIDLYRALADGADIADCVVAWEGDANFSYEHQYGVWVYTPSFYGRCFEIGNYRYYDVTEEDLPENIFYPAQIVGRYLGTDVTLTIDGASKHCLLPKVGMPLANVSGTNMHSYAKNFGASLIDIYNIDASVLLYLVEFANYNIQNTIGSGVSSLNVQGLHPSVASSGNVITLEGLTSAQLANFIVGAVCDLGTSDGGNQTGRREITAISTSGTTTTVTLDSAITVTTSTFVSIHGLANIADEGIGSMSGYIGTNGKANAYYRGEVLFANKFYYVLGAYRQTGDGKIWTCDAETTDDYDALDTAVHNDTGLLLPTTSGYVKTFGLADGLSFAPFCTEIGGNATNPVGDYCYVPALTSANTVLWFGGASNAGDVCGFYGYWRYSAGASYWYCGARPRLKNP